MTDIESRMQDLRESLLKRNSNTWCKDWRNWTL